MSTETRASTNSEAGPPQLDQGTYEILRARLSSHASDLRVRLEQLNRARQDVFGSIPTLLLATERISTANNCIARDIVPIGQGRFLFGYNVHLGLRSETKLEDVFGVYRLEGHHFRELPLDAVGDPQFAADFKNLYRYYKHAVFSRFALIGPALFMEFRVGKNVDDIKTFKWICQQEEFVYVGNRFDHEYGYPAQHEFQWTRAHRELHRHGLHPHISIEDRVFVECIGGDLTIKVEDNTDSGEGIYAEPVDHRDQTLDDAEVFYSIVGSLVLLKIRPYAEKAFRYLVFNEKLKQVQRIDAIADSCVLLPSDQGILFSRGYYLQSGEFKLFETQLTEMMFYKRIAAPNGEDYLFAFYNRERGQYVLLSYNVIARTLETPIICGGFSLFENGEMAVFRATAEPQRHHVIQIWQTPFVGPGWQPEVQSESYLSKLGNPAIVRCMAECQEILTLSAKEDSYAGLYFDLVKKTGDVLDSYFWLDRPEVFGLKAPLVEISKAASAALAEFEKVSSLRRSAALEVARVTAKAADLLRGIANEKFTSLQQYVHRLRELRAMRGELVSTKDLRYADAAALAKSEEAVASSAAKLAEQTVEFLLQPDALNPFRDRAAAVTSAVPRLGKVTEAKALEEEMNAAGQELDLLIETLTNLSLRDATETTRIVEGITAIYSVLNQGRAALKNRIRELRGAEAVAEFASQLRLLDQALANYLDLCVTPEKCSEYLNRMLVQVEELEARFADFDEFVVQLGEKRTALAGAFEARKLDLIESRNRKAGALFTTAERILKSIRYRAERLPSTEEINAYFASDQMVEKVRNLIDQLLELGDSGKADDVQSQLKTIHQNALRQWKDRHELFAAGTDLIQLGRHQFLVNTQELDLTIVPRGEQMCLHLTGTGLFEPIEDPAFAATRPVWHLESVAETPHIYRAEYLAYKCFEQLQKQGRLWNEETAADGSRPESAPALEGEELLALTRDFMAPRYGEGYVKGVHDQDAAHILRALVELHGCIGLLRYHTRARALGTVFWQLLPESDLKALIAAKLRGFGTMKKLFPGEQTQPSYIAELEAMIRQWIGSSGLFEEKWAGEAAEYLYFQLKFEADQCVASPDAAELVERFELHLAARRFHDAFRAARKAVETDPASHFQLLRDWMTGFINALGRDPELPAELAGRAEFIDEAAGMLLRGSHLRNRVVHASLERAVEGLLGNHPRIQNGRLPVHYVEFMHRLRAHDNNCVPLFQQCQLLKKEQVEAGRLRLRLDDFRPRVLTSFVRNRLIDSVYLPLIGDNLAKQIGAAGEAKRTDRMGLLLLISPPGYGKTTLLEYIAHRLGLVFVKINSPALGQRVVSLDPAEAPNAAAREELDKLNLAFEMADNVMVCLDDIQHANPEFLQKFISLCDGQRRIEGVYRGHPRTYDLRGKRFVVTMAGNPYTESGEKFRVPDMLANRADTYNLGDVLGGHQEAFQLSYLENAAGSNPWLAEVVNRAPKDLYEIIRLAQHLPSEGAFEANWSAEQLAEFIEVMKKLARVRDVALRVNEEYIRSAAQSDIYRTEPPFKLQGSYRNMNRLAEKISPIMNDDEIRTLVQDHYRNEAQTLAQGAEANLLKFKELTGTLTPKETARWEEIKKAFRKHLLFRGADAQDPVSQVVQQLSGFADGLESIKEVIAAGIKTASAPMAPPVIPVTMIIAENGRTSAPSTAPEQGPPLSCVALPVTGASERVREVRITNDTLQRIWELIENDPISNANAEETGREEGLKS
ncbi:MAG: DNA repair ATPase [Verrucomicrobiota bacterium]